MISHILLSPPSVEPVTLEDIKAHARIEHNEDDVLITALLAAARQWCEHYTRRAFISQQWDLALSKVPSSREVLLPRGPLLSITQVQMFDDRDNVSLWSSDLYYADTVASPGQLVLRKDASWPSPSRCHNGLVITYEAGYGATGEDVPTPIKLAIKQLVLHWYEYRGDAVSTTMTNKAPLTIEALLDPYRILNVGGRV